MHWTGALSWNSLCDSCKACLHGVKIRLQAQSNSSIAVGHQHDIQGTFPALRAIYASEGVIGLWRGCAGSLPRRCIGSATQLTSFTLCKDILAQNEFYRIEKGYLNSFIASMIGGIAVTIVMTPLDVVSTRLYNQGIDPSGKGMLYEGYFDCLKKIFRTEGFFGFYKGAVPMYLRTGPHTMLVLVLWDTLKDIYKSNKKLGHQM